jgi:hypothetical protein
MDMVLQNLKVMAQVGEFMTDPMGCRRYVFTLLAAHIADLPKQLMITCVSKNVSPVTLAAQAQFDDGIVHPPQDGQSTINELITLSKIIDPWKVREFLERAKQQSLSGVHLPYWCDWQFSDPAIFLIPKLLHTCHKFFFNHILKWCKEVVGANELNA